MSKIASFPSGVDFTNIVCSAFMSEDPKRAKYTVKPSFLFALLGSEFVKTRDRFT